MKRYAALKLIFPSGKSLPHQVVEVGQDGRPLCCYPLHEEQHSTEWLPGVLLLSPMQLCTDDLKNWEGVLEKMNTSTCAKVEVFILYYINLFDMQRMKPMDGSILKQLL